MGLVKLRSGFPTFNIEIIDVDDMLARPQFFQYIANILDSTPRGNILTSGDFLRAITREERALVIAEQTDKKKREKLRLDGHLEQLKKEFQDRLEREVEERERDQFRKKEERLLGRCCQTQRTKESR